MTTHESPLHEFHADYAALVTSIKATKTSTNPHFKNRYASLDTWLDEVHKHMATNGFICTESTRVCMMGEDLVQILTTRLEHITGNTLQSDYLVGLLDKPQAMGSNMTYARRYNIQLVLNCTGEDDDDANVAQSASPERTTVPMGTRRKVS